MSRKLILYISMSLDGYIAGKNGALDFLDDLQIEGEDYGYGEFIKSVDTIIIGRKTYDKVKAMGYDYPHTDKNVFIITGEKKSDEGSFKYYNGDLKDLVLKLKSEEGANIYCDGGAQIANFLLKAKLIDELILSIIPVVLGEGISLFHSKPNSQKLALLSSKSYKTGLTQLHYAFKA